ncbi:MAG TPA: aminoacyl-tRNA hydrolase [Anaerolineaceae bacterium]|nr:aminoacyl-tRNA hydrolase [Anaerolineaceae bacterium]
MVEISEPEKTSFLIVGLGNPGREYRETRHNVGFMVVDLVGLDFGIQLSRLQSRALVGSGTWKGRKVILAKPQTYMNLSGQAVSSLVRFYKIPFEDLLVVHDDVDLAVGTLRIRPGGGSAGQKGLASIIQQLGTEEFPRLRVGIGHPQGQRDVADYVLDSFFSSEKDLVLEVLDRAVEAAKDFILYGINHAMNQFNGSLEKE